MTTKSSISSGAHAADPLPYFVWSDSLFTGNEAIDADHRRLFDIAERLRRESLQAQDNAAIGNSVDELLDYVQGHFAREEALMAATNYPDLEHHRLEHTLLTRHVQKLTKSFRDEKPVASTQIWQFLRRWLRYHIMETDREMASYAAAVSLHHAGNKADSQADCLSK
ncbi:MAG TPA: bacteriohemerythrin [Noviherbaspirillum sp.]|uniref:bacteriohemerythrin n=1 Tax=Noviherbaspirillum sp. TaxID=1926288 RepID=UPI002B47AE09|nr:bacteriohemerythrin [Noviherbaspirillum sp.]HJV84090.1 bacteriohemerythrin [Noviherbaspirillum sp.]